MTNKIKATRKEPTKRDPLVRLAEILIDIDRRENVIDKEKIRNATKSK